MIECSLDHMILAAGQTLDKFGKDQTGTVEYCINKQGWRSEYEYNFVPSYAFFGCSIVFGIGVPESQRFSNLFERSHNYGLAGRYGNADIAETIQEFVNSEWYTPQVKMAVVWTSRDEDTIDEHWHKIENYAIQHFFCGYAKERGYPMIRPLDADASGTHMGPKSHSFLNKVLCANFSQ